MRLPPLNALKAFDAVARTGSFKAAAAELCVTLGAVSRHVKGLEAYLGVRLLDRGQRGIALTAPGAAYHAEVLGALRAISAATQTVADGRNARMLRLKLPPTCATRWLVPRLGRFGARHPDIAIQLTTSHEPPNFETEDLDAAVHYGRTELRAAATDRLFREVLIPVMAPALARVPLRRPEELSRQQLLHSIHRPHDWPQWFEAAGLGGLKLGAGLSFENSLITYQGAIDGVGAAMAQAAFVVDEVRTGRLVVPFDIPVRSADCYTFAVPRARADVPRIRQFRAWVLEEAELTRQAGARYRF